MTKIARFLTAYAVAAVLLALAGGCGGGRNDAVANEGDYRPGEAFRPADETPEVTRMNNAQIAAGARTDATLRPYHFDEAGLNSLGREKLDHMVSGGPRRTGTLVVYLDAASDGDDKGLDDARREAVTEYLTGLGLTRDAFRLEMGHNSRATTPARTLQPAQGAAPVLPTFGGGGSGGGFGQPTK